MSQIRSTVVRSLRERKESTCRALLAAMLGIYLAFAAVAQAAEPAAEPAAEKSLDEQLLKDLSGDLDSDLLQGLPAPPKKPATADDAKNGKPRAKVPAGEDIGAEPEAVDPLQKISQRMRSVEERIGNRDLSLETRELQKEIVDDLAALIEQAKKQQSGSGKKKSGGQGRGSAQAGAADGNPTPGPANDSTNRVEKGSASDIQTNQVQDVMQRFWGHLPEKMREELQNSLSEQFLPKYEKLIEEYYKRLAEERPGSP